MRRRKYLTFVASGTAIAAAGCLGNEDDEETESADNETDDAAGEETNGTDQGDGESEGSDSLDEPVDVVLENNYDHDYTIEVAVSRDGQTLFDDEIDVQADTTERFEDVVSEPGEYHVEATKSEDITASDDIEITEDMTEVYVRIAETGEFTVGSDA